MALPEGSAIPRTGFIRHRVGFAALLLATVACIVFFSGSSREKTEDYSDPIGAALADHESVPDRLKARNQASHLLDPVSAALRDHGDASVLTPRSATKVKVEQKQRLWKALKAASWNIANEKAREDHPWDDLPEGLPTKDGRMVSAAELTTAAGENDVDVLRQAHVQASQKAQAAQRLASKHSAVSASHSDQTTGDPLATYDLAGAIAEHENLDERTRPHPEAAASKTDRPVSKSKPAPHAHQGFVAGDHLRVSAQEFHHEMRRFLPSSQGRLISPYEWFQTGGRGWPSPAPKAKKPAH